MRTIDPQLYYSIFKDDTVFKTYNDLKELISLNMFGERKSTKYDEVEDDLEREFYVASLMLTNKVLSRFVTLVGY